MGGNRKGHWCRPDSLSQRCIAVVIKLGTATIHQVAAAVGRHIDPSRALQTIRKLANTPSRKAHGCHWESCETSRKIEAGKLCIVRSTLRYLHRRGKIKRVSPGVYTVPDPVIYDPGVPKGDSPDSQKTA